MVTGASFDNGFHYDRLPGKHCKHVFRSVTLILALLMAMKLHAASFTSLDLINYNPLPQLYGLPYSYQTGVLEQSRSEAGLLFDKTSFYALKMNSNEMLLLDGESSHVTFVYNQGLGNDWQWGVVIPWFSYEDGTMDGFLVNWHDFFGMPQSGRDEAPRNRLKLLYQRNGSTLIDIAESNNGIGDVRLNASWAILKRRNAKGPGDTSLQDNTTTLNLGLKLPTGDSNILHGSGAADLALWLAGERATTLYDYRSGWYGSLGLLALGKGDVMPEQQKKLVIFGGAGLGVQYSPAIQFQVQLDMHSRFYSGTSLKEVGGKAVQFTMGGTVALSAQTRLNIGVSEDLNIDASPDVNFHFGLKTLF